MGQYYKPIFLNKEKTKPLSHASSHDFGSGLKLMEHSYIGNDFVGFVEKQLILEPRNLVWAGDYADPEDSKNLTKEDVRLIMLDGDYEEKDLKDMNLSSLSYILGSKMTHDKSLKDFEAIHNHKFNEAVPKRFKYLINLDKKEFVDKSKCKDIEGWEGAQIHPLPLLTCEGNGRGGGDFRGENKFIGTWSRDLIGVVSKKGEIPQGFKEIIPNFEES